MPLPEDVERDLAVIDRALAGAAVDPDDAELAETVLLLAAGRPLPAPDVAARLDARVLGPADASAASAGRRAARPRWWSSSRVVARPAWGGGLAAAVVAAVVAFVVLGQPGHPPRALFSAHGPSQAPTRHPAAGAPAAAKSAAPVMEALGGTSSPPVANGLERSVGVGSAASAVRSPLTPDLAVLSPTRGLPNPTADFSPSPQANGRRIIHTASMVLTAAPTRIGVVAQELFDVVGSEQGVVQRSNVTSGEGGFASFTLSIPTQNLAATLSRLAQLRYANVTSSTASTQDVNSEYLDGQRGLADQRAVRASLLRRIAAATSAGDLATLRADLAGVESRIAATEAFLNGLQSRLDDSSVTVQIEPAADGGGPSPSPPSRGFTLHRALHDAVLVLRTVAGIGLITLVVLLPLAAVGLFVVTLARLTRGRARERALDGA